jgi:hypothetical protein
MQTRGNTGFTVDGGGARILSFTEKDPFVSPGKQGTRSSAQLQLQRPKVRPDAGMVPRYESNHHTYVQFDLHLQAVRLRPLVGGTGGCSQSLGLGCAFALHFSTSNL